MYWLHVANRLVSFVWFAWFVLGGIWSLEIATRHTCTQVPRLRIVVLVTVSKYMPEEEEEKNNNVESTYFRFVIV